MRNEHDLHKKIVQLVVEELDDPQKGNVTIFGVIRALEEAAKDLNNQALGMPANHFLKEES